MMTLVLVRTVIKLSTFSDQLMASIKRKLFLVILRQCSSSCIVHNMVITLALGKGLTKKMMHMNSVYCNPFFDIVLG